MIGVNISAIQVMILEKMRSGKIIGVNQDWNRKYVSLLTAVYAIAMKIPLVFFF